uniref:Uncharacterized protein n=1 Tax=Anguilla anguilla TaxID=7936 RepID=A0A0E9R2K4_ANGAN
MFSQLTTMTGLIISSFNVCLSVLRLPLVRVRILCSLNII